MSELETMENKPVELTLLDGKKYKFSALAFPDAFKLADKLNLVDMVPIVSLMDKQKREVLLEILELMFSSNHPKVTKEVLKKEKILDLSHVRKIIAIALDLNEIKK